MSKGMNKIYELAEAAYEAHGDSEVALDKLVDEIIQDDALVEGSARFAAKHALAQSRRIVRCVIEGEPQKRYSKAFQQQIQVACGQFLKWPLMDGTELAKATKEHVLRDAERFQANADGNARKARFLKLVAERLQDGELVGEVLTDGELRKLMEEAKTATVD